MADAGESMNEQPDDTRRGYDQYALERDRAELERLLIQHEATEQMRTELDMARLDAAKGESYQLCAGCGWPDVECQCPTRDDVIAAARFVCDAGIAQISADLAKSRDSVDQTERIMSDLRHEDLVRDDALWDEAYDQFLDEVYANEQFERAQDEEDEGRNDH